MVSHKMGGQRSSTTLTSIKVTNHQLVEIKKLIIQECLKSQEFENLLYKINGNIHDLSQWISVCKITFDSGLGTRIFSTQMLTSKSLIILKRRRGQCYLLRQEIGKKMRLTKLTVENLYQDYVKLCVQKTVMVNQFHKEQWNHIFVTNKFHCTNEDVKQT